MKPEPRDWVRRDWPLSSNSLKKSSKGEPSGKRGSDGPSPPLITIEVEILTTAGDSRSAKSAKLSGLSAARAEPASTVTQNINPPTSAIIQKGAGIVRSCAVVAAERAGGDFATEEIIFSIRAILFVC